MNKQEAIERIKNIGTLNIYDKVAGQQVDMVIKNQVLEIISQIEEPQKPVVPKFVVDWVDDSREYRFDFDEWLNCENQPVSVRLWLNQRNKRQAELNAFALVTLIVNGADAVEVEKEKLYTVEIQNPNLNAHTVLQKTEKGVVLISVTNARWRGWESSKLTESEIKQDFDFLWQFAKEVE